MKKLMGLAVSAIIFLSGCEMADETYTPEKYAISAETQNAENPGRGISSEISAGSTSSTSSTSSAARQSSSSGAAGSVKSSSVKSAAKETPKAPVIRKNELAYILKDVYSGGKSYYVVISGTKCTSENPNALKINGTLYDNFAISLYDGGKLISRLKPEIPADVRFIILGDEFI